MFGQIIDLLVKQDEEKRRIIFIFLKLFFCGTITSKIYSDIFGTYDIILITDFKALFDFSIHGNAFICFILFYIVWSVSYELTYIILTYFAIWIAGKLYDLLSILVNNIDETAGEISKHYIFQKLVNFYNMLDILEVENNVTKPGRNFYKFYDYLLDVENEKIIVSIQEFTDTIAILVQFIFIYNILGLDFLSSSYLLWFSAIFITLSLIVTSLIALTLSVLVDNKHSRLLKLMEKLQPDYKMSGKFRANNINEFK